ncbi:nucleoside triphosphate pyrophosphohydrolase [Paenibacillus sp.]|uniref:nucleoside triphosphate pyrophosphohydrolase n=1 Tax=Paenibacillus sp. TaxID=58172 RepID=UPI002D4D14D9|nr:nucleoside triphosphate pyrophosphohydrolase [Paenibacillus sp.]HZG55801.1 nucleoside triphosphate pyrophosphohydrolase [Paenibacillus sp.]
MLATKAGRIVVAGLGPGGPDGLTLGAWDAIRGAERLLLRTGLHPVVAWLREQGIAFETYDETYEANGRFEDVYEAIVADVLRRAKEGERIVYAVPGHPSVAETTVALLRARCPEAGVELRLVGGESFLDRAFVELGFDPADGFQLADATDFHAERLDPYNHIVITQVYDALVASDVKLGLMDRYPDDYEVVVGHALGVAGEQRIERVPLYELDRIGGYGNLSLVYVPPTDRDDVHYRTFERLHAIIAKLRSPEGCPWDREQTHRSLRKYFIEETFEAVETIDEDDMDALRDELGDVLLQIMLHAQIEEEAGAFTIYDVIAGLAEKMVRRHPHVFGDVRVGGVDDVLATWQGVKAKEREAAGEPAPASVLDGVPSGLPAMLRAVALQKKAAKVGFDWDEPASIADKIVEELREFQDALADGGERRDERLLDEMGDLLFAVVNLARFLKLDPEEALSATNRKFMQRFRYIEERLRLSGKSFDQTDIGEMERYWQEAKRS